MQLIKYPEQYRAAAARENIIQNPAL